MSSQDFVILDGSKVLHFIKKITIFMISVLVGWETALRMTLLETKDNLNSLKNGRNRP
jgi:hypothetical protein